MSRLTMSQAWLAGLLLAGLAALPLTSSCERRSGDAEHGDAHEEHAEGEEHDEHEEGEEHGEHGEHEEGESGEVHLTEAQARSAQIEVVRVGPGRVTQVLRLPASIEHNQDAQVHINPRVPGLVQSIFKGLGDRVAAGDALCEIDSIELGNAVAQYVEARALADMGRNVLEREAALLDRGVEVATRIHERERGLAEKEISTRRPLYEAERALRDAELARESRVLQLQTELRQREIQAQAAAARLRVLGLSAEEISALPERAAESAPAALGRYVLRAPRNGVIVSRHITQGEMVDPETKLFAIDDLDRVWAVGSVYEKDLTAVSVGQRAFLRLNAFPGQAFEGEVAFIGFEVDPETRSVPVRVELANERVEAWSEKYPLRPGLFGAIEIVVDEREAAVVLPEAAIVHEGDASLVFVREGERRFARRPVRVRAAGHDVVEVLEGLAAGEDVAITGTFTLKSMARSAELGGGHSH